VVNVRVAAWLLAAVGIVLCVIATAGYLLSKSGKSTLAFLIVGAGLMLAGSLITRVRRLKIGLTGIDIRVDIAVAERQVKAGELADGGDLLGDSLTTERQRNLTLTARLDGALDLVVFTTAAAADVDILSQDVKREIVYALAKFSESPTAEGESIHLDGGQYRLLRSGHAGLIVRPFDATTEHEPKSRPRSAEADSGAPLTIEEAREALRALRPPRYVVLRVIPNMSDVKRTDDH
jgi:hypothetical protein